MLLCYTYVLTGIEIDDLDGGSPFLDTLSDFIS